MTTRLLILSFLSFMSLSANANWWDRNRKPSNFETQEPAPKKEEVVQEPTDDNKRLKESVKRKVASTEPGSTATSEERVSNKRRPKRRPSNAQYRLGLLAGIGSAAVKDTTSSASGQINVAVLSDIQVSNFGLDLDAFYTTGAGATASVGAINTAVTNQIGGYGALKVLLPFYLGSTKWIPKFGLGYAMHKLEQTDTSAGTTVTANSNLSGIFAMGGMEIRLLPWWIVIGDYAQSLAANGKMDFSDSTSLTMSSASFARLRAGTFVVIADHFDFGVQFVSRTQSWTSTNSFNESQSQVLGLLGYQW